MLQQSAILTLLGMAIVFFFLWIMIICINGVGKLVHKMGLDKDIEQPPAGAPKTTGTVKQEVAAAISAAVTEYRKK
jgi:oxaloacetate decarboxylase gamma subunit